jgi:hypothetical protein
LIYTAFSKAFCIFIVFLLLYSKDIFFTQINLDVSNLKGTLLRLFWGFFWYDGTENNLFEIYDQFDVGLDQ